MVDQWRSLRRICREVILKGLLSRDVNGDDVDWCESQILQIIVDRPCMHMLNSVVSMSDLYAHGVVNVELITNERDPLPGLDALYIIHPGSVERICSEYVRGMTPQHRFVHLAFTERVDAAVLEKIAGYPQLASRVKSLVEVPLTFVPIQQLGFHTNDPCAIRGISPCNYAVADNAAKQLANICRFVRASNATIRHAVTDMCKLVAENLASDLETDPPEESPTSVDVLIVDRSIDMVCPVIHEYTYECLVYDFLRDCFDSDRSVVKMNGREVSLSDSDPLWPELKHLHLTEVQNILQKRVQELQASQVQSQQDTKDVLSMLSKLPGQKQEIESLHLHLFINERLNKSMVEQNIISALGPLEQDMACGVDDTGRAIKAPFIITSLRKLVSTPDLLTEEAKLRLILLCFAALRQVPQENMLQVISLANLSENHQSILKKLMDSPVIQPPRPDKSSTMEFSASKDQVRRFKANARDESRASLSRFEPRLADLIDRLVENSLPAEEFPILRTTTDRSSSQSRLREVGKAEVGKRGSSTHADMWGFDERPASRFKSSESEQEDPDVARVERILLVFVVGGITHSELRVAAERNRTLPKSTVLQVGGTEILTPATILEYTDLASAANPGCDHSLRSSGVLN